MILDIAELSDAFPAFRVAAVVATGLTLPAARPEALAQLIAAREARVRQRWGGQELGSIPGIHAWRLAYKAVGIRKTSYRCSVERLIKNALADRPLPAINPFVDAYNAVSMTHVFPIGADDLDRVEGDLAFRYARPDDSFVDMSGGDGEEGAATGPAEDPPKPGEVVYADAAKVLCRRWNWRQDARALVSPASRRIILTVQSIGIGDLDAAAADVATLIRQVCGGDVQVTFADAASPRVSLAGL